MGNLYNRLKKYEKEDICPMHMPGHKRNIDMLGGIFPYDIDITEIYGFDNLHHPEGVIKEIEDKAKRLFSSNRSFILVNRKHMWNFGWNRSSCKNI
jgi:arginine decarboxylase